MNTEINSMDLPQFTSSLVILRVSQFLQKCLSVSTKPQICNSYLSKPNDKLRCRKWIFDDDGGLIKSNVEPETSAVVLDKVAAPSSSQPMNKSMSSADYKGGGIRKGFGNLLDSNQTIGTLSSSSLNVKMSKKLVLDEHHDSSQINHDVIDDEIPCIDPTELEPDILENERKRASNLLLSLLQSSVKPTKSTKSSSSDKITENSDKNQPFVNLDVLKDIYRQEVS
jgi:hypothetical protein